MEVEDSYGTMTVAVEGNKANAYAILLKSSSSTFLITQLATTTTTAKILFFFKFPKCFLPFNCVLVCFAMLFCLLIFLAFLDHQCIIK
jgi:hypothetical protein